jgi:hypothetical protein
MLKAKQRRKAIDIVLRSLIPSAALVAWLMLERISAFDAAYGGLRDACRYPVAALVLAVLSIISLASGPTTRPSID